MQRINGQVSVKDFSADRSTDHPRDDCNLIGRLAHNAQREALVLHYWQGQSLAKIGKQLGRSAAAVAGLLQRGLKDLRRQMAAAE